MAAYRGTADKSHFLISLPTHFLWISHASPLHYLSHAGIYQEKWGEVILGITSWSAAGVLVLETGDGEPDNKAHPPPSRAQVGAPPANIHCNAMLKWMAAIVLWRSISPSVSLSEGLTWWQLPFTSCVVQKMGLRVSEAHGGGRSHRQPVIPVYKSS